MLPKLIGSTSNKAISRSSNPTAARAAVSRRSISAPQSYAPTQITPTAAPQSYAPIQITPTAAPRVGGLDSLARQIASQVRVPAKQYRLEDVFSKSDQGLARQNIASRVARLLDPEQVQGQENINTEFANRGIFRSGLRQKGLSDFGADIAEKRALQEEELFNVRMTEALQELARRQEEAEREAALVNQTVNFRDYL